MQKIYIDIKDIQNLLFERKQIITLMNNTEIWRRIPLEQRLELVDSYEFQTLMGESFTAQTRQLLMTEVEALASTIH